MVEKLKALTSGGGAQAHSQAALSEKLAMQCALALFISHLVFPASSLPGTVSAPLNPFGMGQQLVQPINRYESYNDGAYTISGTSPADCFCNC